MAGGCDSFGGAACLHFTPASVVTSGSIIALITCNPALTLRVSSPPRILPAICAIDTVTCSGTVNPCASGALLINL